MKYTYFTNLVFVARSLLFLTKTTAGNRSVPLYSPLPQQYKIILWLSLFDFFFIFYRVLRFFASARFRLWISTLLSENHFFVGIS